MRRNQHADKFRAQALRQGNLCGTRSLRDIADVLNMSAGTPRKWWRKFNGAAAQPALTAELPSDLPVEVWNAAQCRGGRTVHRRKATRPSRGIRRWASPSSSIPTPGRTHSVLVLGTCACRLENRRANAKAPCHARQTALKVIGPWASVGEVEQLGFANLRRGTAWAVQCARQLAFWVLPQSAGCDIRLCALPAFASASSAGRQLKCAYPGALCADSPADRRLQEPAWR